MASKVKKTTKKEKVVATIKKVVSKKKVEEPKDWTAFDKLSDKDLRKVIQKKMAGYAMANQLLTDRKNKANQEAVRAQS